MKTKTITRFSALAAAVMLGGCSSFGFGSKSDDSNDLPTRIEKKTDYKQAYQDYVELGAKYVQMGRYDLAEPKLKRAI